MRAKTTTGAASGDTREYLRRKLPELQDRLGAFGAIPINARQPLDQVVNAILSHTLANSATSQASKTSGQLSQICQWTIQLWLKPNLSTACLDPLDRLRRSLRGWRETDRERRITVGVRCRGRVRAGRVGRREHDDPVGGAVGGT